MSDKWPRVPLGEVMCRAEDWVTIQPSESYREVTVRLWGKGVALRREVLGAEIKADRRLRVRQGQFIASRIDARNGAFGLVPAELDGAVVSSDFPVFEPNSQNLHVSYLGWFSRTATFVELCKAASEGTTNRVRLKEDRFLATSIPLPPIEEQLRIVHHIETVAAKVSEAQRLRDESEEACQAICRSVLFKEAATHAAMPMRELVRRRPSDVIVQPTSTYHFAGVYCFGKGMFRGQRRLNTQTERFFEIGPAECAKTPANPHGLSLRVLPNPLTWRGSKSA